MCVWEAMAPVGGHRLPKWIMSGKLEDAPQCARGGGREKERTDRVVGEVRMFEIKGDCRAAASEPRTWYGIVSEGASRFMTAWKKEQETKTDGGRVKRKRRTRLW